MLKIAWDNTIGMARLQLDELGSLARDSGLESVVLLSLFTDLEATETEVRAAGLSQQRGWWADSAALREPDQPRLGSKLWLLTRGKTTLATLRQIEQYSLESLRWLVEAKIAAKVVVAATRPALGTCTLDVTIIKPNKLLPPYRRLWEMHTDALV